MINGFFIIYESFSLLLFTEEIRMKTVGQKIEAFAVTGVKPGFNQHEEQGVSAFEPEFIEGLTRIFEESIVFNTVLGCGGSVFWA